MGSAWRGYDGLNRLTESKDAANTVWQSYHYDKTGNRMSAGRLTVQRNEDCPASGDPCTPLPPTTQWTTENYTYAAGSHRLTYQGTTERRYDTAGNTIWIGPLPVSGPGDPPPGGGGETESASYEGTLQVADDGGPGDSAGGAAGDPARSFVYDASNRLRSLSVDGEFAMGYRYTGLGERVYRNGGTITVHTVFDEQGRWRGDYDASGLLIQEAVYLDGLPVGLIARVNGHDRLYYVQPDALGTPRVVIDPTRDVAVWRWDLDTDAFGNDKPNEDPDDDGIAFVFDQRFPGQQYDSATGFNYNYFRDYDSSTGRYVQSDLIGLAGGISTYGYVAGDPLTRIDPRGLTFQDVVNTNRQVNTMFPELNQRGLLMCADLPEDVDGRTQNLSGNILIPRKYCEMECLSRDDWENLFWTLFHEGMHSTDPWWLRLSQNAADEERWHTGIFYREMFEQDRARGIKIRWFRYDQTPIWGTPRFTPVNLNSLYKEYRSQASGCCGGE